MHILVIVIHNSDDDIELCILPVHKSPSILQCTIMILECNPSSSPWGCKFYNNMHHWLNWKQYFQFKRTFSIVKNLHLWAKCNPQEDDNTDWCTNYKGAIYHNTVRLCLMYYIMLIYTFCNTMHDWLNFQLKAAFSIV